MYATGLIGSSLALSDIDALVIYAMVGELTFILFSD